MTPKQERFAAEYRVDLNATAAAKRAGYSEKTAYSQGQRLLKHVEIRNAIAQEQEKAVTGPRMDADAIVAELESVYQKTSEIATAQAYGVATRCLELLGKRHAMFTDKQIVDATVAQKAPAEVPEPQNYAEWKAAKRMDRAFPTTGGNGNGNGNRVTKALADE